MPVTFPDSKKFSSGTPVLYLSAGALFIYLAIRAKNISITWDEAQTFFEYVRTPRWLPHDLNYMSANNHLLNTWLMKISVSLFGSGELALRLPNVLAGGIFFTALIATLKQWFGNNWRILPVFLIIALQPWLLDYFSIARGYGLSVAMMMCGIFYSGNFFSSGKMSSCIKAQLFFLLATAANLALIHVLVASALFFVCFLYSDKTRRRRNYLVPAFIPLIAIVFLFPYAQKLNANGAFFLGDEVHSPFFLFSSLGKSTAYIAPYSDMLALPLVIFFSAIPFLVAIQLFLRMKNTKDRTTLFVLVLLVLSFILPVMQHFILGSNYISGRVTLFYLPLLLLLFSSFTMNSGKAGKYMLGATSVFFIIHFCFCVNTKHYYDCSEQENVKDAMKILRDQKIKVDPPFFADMISTDLPYDLPVNYYRMRYSMNEFGHTVRSEFLRNCGYYYLPMEDTALYAMADILKYFPETKTALFRLMDPPPQKLKTIAESWDDFENEDPYSELMTAGFFIGKKGTFAGGKNMYSIAVVTNVPDSVKEIPVAATLSCRIRIEKRNTSALIVFTAITANGDSWEGMHVSELNLNPGEWSITGWTRTLPKGTKQVKVFLWNGDEAKVYMDNVTVRILAKDKKDQ
ncbi:MAG: hypothetical protein HY064_10680 [Bacteroidetes bacterium]|nr:hypothetical protein [Bacteroidota bacterium]